MVAGYREKGAIWMAGVDDFDEVVEQYHLALDEIMKGSAQGYKRVYSRRDDVTLANPFGPPARGWDEVAQTLERAASHYRDGEATGFENVAKYTTAELAYTVEIERCQAKVEGRDDITPIAVRVTTIFRPEDGTWKVVHRHADPIMTTQPAESVIQE
jgi:ketosteroid isomerase-like protein